MNLHPLTRVIIRALERISGEYLDGLPQCQPQRFIYLGEAWVRRICKTLTAYLPLPRPEQAQGRTEKKLSMPEFLRSQADATSPARLEHSKPPTQTPEGLAPLEGPMPPSLERNRQCRPTRDQQVANAWQRRRMTAAGGSPLLMKNRKRLWLSFQRPWIRPGGKAAIGKTCAPKSWSPPWRKRLFNKAQSPAAPPTETKSSSICPVVNLLEAGYSDRPLGLTNDSQAVENLKIQARPVTEQLRRNLYPSLDHRPQTLRLRTGGVLDGGRLALAGFCPAVFKRFRNVEMADKRGKPVLVIAWRRIRFPELQPDAHAEIIGHGLA